MATMLLRSRRLRTLAASLVLGGVAACSGQPKIDESRGSQPPSETTPAAAKSEAAAAKPDPTVLAAEGDPAGATPKSGGPSPAAPEPTDGLSPLADAQRALLVAGVEDPPFNVEIHYIQSNETRHDLFFPYIEGIGGAFIGVGSDQSFTMVATAKSELMFMLDIDTRVVDLHRMYEVLVPVAESPQALVDAFHERNAETTKAALQVALEALSEGELDRLLTGFRVGRETVYRHLVRVIGRKVDDAPASWLSDPEQFAHIQDLYRKNRVRIMVGNLAGEESLRTVGKACEALGVPVRVLYMSNAEEYFKYTPEFRTNMESLPIDDTNAVVLRTIYSKKWTHADLWAYQVQPLSDFRTRLQDGKNRSRNPMLRLAENADELERQPGPKGLSLVALPARQ